MQTLYLPPLRLVVQDRRQGLGNQVQVQVRQRRQEREIRSRQKGAKLVFYWFNSNSIVDSFANLCIVEHRELRINLLKLIRRRRWYVVLSGNRDVRVARITNSERGRLLIRRPSSSSRF